MPPSTNYDLESPLSQVELQNEVIDNALNNEGAVNDDTTGEIIQNGTFTIRMLDIIASSIGLILAAPLFLLIAILIKLEGDGPVFFVQERLGLFKKGFNIYKFRSMRTDAEKDGPQWCKEEDNRITIVGQWLRNTRLDELPQLFNVFKGELSLVGPRPIREHFANILKSHDSRYDQRFNVKPGLTGWAQVYAPYGSTIEEQMKKLPYDLKYSKRFTVFDYIFVLFMTVKVVVLGKGV